MSSSLDNEGAQLIIDDYQGLLGFRLKFSSCATTTESRSKPDLQKQMKCLILIHSLCNVNPALSTLKIIERNLVTLLFFFFQEQFVKHLNLVCLFFSVLFCNSLGIWLTCRQNNWMFNVLSDYFSNSLFVPPCSTNADNPVKKKPQQNNNKLQQFIDAGNQMFHGDLNCVTCINTLQIIVNELHFKNVIFNPLQMSF